MGMTSPFPEPPSPDLARFVVRSRVEIVSALRQLRDQHLLVTLYYGDDTAFAVGSVLDVHAGADELIVDLTVDASRPRGDRRRAARWSWSASSTT